MDEDKEKSKEKLLMMLDDKMQEILEEFGGDYDKLPKDVANWFDILNDAYDQIRIN